MITNYSYDNLSRLLSVLHQAGGTTTIDGASYTYDNAGNRMSKSNSLDSSNESYAYDAIYQLQQVTHNSTVSESYTYDPVGNRMSSLGVSPYSYNSSNELTSTPTATFTYDHNGNTLTKTDSSGTTQYAWDFENRLTSVTLPNGAGVVSFTYDPFGRRIEKSGPSGTVIYAYDGANGVEELNASGAATARYVEGSGIDEPLAQSGTALNYYEADGLGSTTSMTDSTGTASQIYMYDAYGNLTGSAGQVANAYRYTQREYDQDTGLYFYRARYYDPQIGRFLSEDEIGNDEGTNLYVYVGNDPVDSTDPTGFYKLKGFPPELQNQMNDAISQAIQKLSETCPSCAGPDAPKIVHALQTATYVYKPNANYCGYTIPVPLFRHIDVSGLAFDTRKCCQLASTLTHEASHLGAGTSDKGPGNAYQIEKECFGCGTGEEPPKAPKGK